MLSDDFPQDGLVGNNQESTQSVTTSCKNFKWEIGKNKKRRTKQNEKKHEAKSPQ